jgi:dihydroorotate dehydrogenase (NAD+) catalytic subunit
MGLRAVEVVRRAIGPEPLIIGMGGIGASEHIEQFRAVGADLFGVGSALTGLDSEGMKAYFRELEQGLGSPKLRKCPGSDGPDARVDMAYHPATVESIRFLTEDLFELTLSSLPGVSTRGEMAGRYFFLCVQGQGEKPFAVLSQERRSILIKSVGIFTRYLATLQPGSAVLLRGPYGKPVDAIPGVSEYLLVGGGTGIASLPEVAAKLAAPGVSIHAILGARREAELYALDDFARFGQVLVATDDGSAGFKGRVSGLLDEVLAAMPPSRRAELALILCGPEPMIHACGDVAGRFVPPDRIIGAVEYQTSCGVGICGKCAAPDGHLSCIDGPFLPLASFGQAACGAGQPETAGSSRPA